MEPFIGQIILFAGNFEPRNWAICDGRYIDIMDNQSLYSILGTRYGGDGRTSFALPDLRGRVPLGVGRGLGLTTRLLGQMSGTEADILTVDELPAHTHSVDSTAEINVKIPVNNEESAIKDPTNGYPGKTSNNAYADETTPGKYMANPEVMSNISVSVEKTGGNNPHNNMQPFLGLNYIICINGLYPSRN